MGILSWIVFGFVAGLIARAIVPGRQNMGFLMTSLLGIGGSFLGGLVASAIGGYSMTEFSSAGLIGSVVGAIVLLVAAGAVLTRGSGHIGTTRPTI